MIVEAYSDFAAGFMERLGLHRLSARRQEYELASQDGEAFMLLSQDEHVPPGDWAFRAGPGEAVREESP